MNEPLAYWNNHFLPQSQLRIAVNDAGFVFGATVTDLCRTFRKRLYRLDDHLLRFQRSCLLAEIPQCRSNAEIQLIAQKLVDHNASVLEPHQELILVLFATPGEIGYYLGSKAGPDDAEPTFCAYTFALPFERYARLFREGAQLEVPAFGHRPGGIVAAQVKHRSRLHWWIAERRAGKGASVLLVDAEGHVTETATSNILIVRQGRVVSPSRHRILGGISLQVVEELCQSLGIPFDESDLMLNDCLNAEEAFLTSSPYCLAPVRQLGAHIFEWPGPTFERLLRGWNQQVGVDIRQQILQAT